MIIVPTSLLVEALRGIDFGSGDAGSELDLEDFFVLPPWLEEVATGDYDLILGPKGSGKTAAARSFRSTAGAIPKPSDVIVTSLVDETALMAPTTESVSAPSYTALVASWLELIAQAVGEAVLVELPRADVESWESEVLGRGRGLEKVRSFVQRSGSLEAPPSATGDEDRIQVARTRLSLAAEHLDKLGRRVWIVVDKLDAVVLADVNMQYQIDAVHALLRAILVMRETCGRHVRVKALLRTDLYNRIGHHRPLTQKNALRTTRMCWEAEDLRELVLARLRFLSEKVPPFAEIMRRLGAEPDDELSVLDAFLGKDASGLSSPPCPVSSPLGWITAVGADAPLVHNPRNVVGLIEQARVHRANWVAKELRAGRESVRIGSVLTVQDLEKGRRSLSQARFDDTLEDVLPDPDVLRLVKRGLRGKPARYRTVQALMETLGLQSETEMDELLDRLAWAGLVAQREDGVWTVGPVYQPALNSVPTTKV